MYIDKQQTYKVIFVSIRSRVKIEMRKNKNICQQNLRRTERNASSYVWCIYLL